jgi:hypothetical protein
MPKWREWETTSEADWTLALERESEYEAEAIGQASMRWPLLLRQRFCIGSALPHTKALALYSVSSHNEFLQTI